MVVHIERYTILAVKCVKVYLLSHVLLFVIPWTTAHQAPSVHGILQARILACVVSSFSSGFF